MREERKLKKVSSDVFCLNWYLAWFMLSTVQFAMFELPEIDPAAAHILP